MKTTADRFRYSLSWRVTVTCVQCDRVYRLQYPTSVNGEFKKEKDVLDYRTKCKCGSWYAVYRYNKAGV